MHAPSELILVKPSLSPASRTASANGLGVNTRGYQWLYAVCHLGAHDRTTGDETIEFQVAESADDSSFADITGATTGALGNVVPNATSGNVYILEVNLMKPGRLQYMRAETVASGTTPIDLCAVTFHLTNARNAPVTQDATVVRV